MSCMLRTHNIHTHKGSINCPILFNYFTKNKYIYILQLLFYYRPLSKGLLWKPSIFSDRCWHRCCWQTWSIESPRWIPRQAHSIETHERLSVKFIKIAEAKSQHCTCKIISAPWWELRGGEKTVTNFDTKVYFRSIMRMKNLCTEDIHMMFLLYRYN